LRARLDLASLITGQLYVELNMFPGSPVRKAPNYTDYHQIPSVPSLQSGLQQSLSDLIAKQPELSKGVNQMLELLNFLTADGGAENLAQGVRSMANLATVLADPNGPLLQTLDQMPTLTSDLRDSIAAVPGLVRQANNALTSVDGLVGGAESPAARTLTELEATLVATRNLSQQLLTVVGQVRTPVAGFAQSGLPQLQGLIQDVDRAVGEVSRTVRDLRQDPARFLLGDPAAGGVKLK
jgi:paraquat-inducible protein B